MKTQHYQGLQATFRNREDWTLPRVLARHANDRPESVYLDAPEESATWTFSELQIEARRIGANLREAGAEQGDRIVIMGSNSSQYVRSWFGSAHRGMVEVPLNTAYEHSFLSHQVATSEARWAVIDDVYADRFIAVRDECPSLEAFWVIDTGEREGGISRLRDAGWTAQPWEELLAAGPDWEEPVVRYNDLASIFFTSGTTGPSKGVAMPHAQMYFFGDETRALSRFTSADTYFAATPLFHGNAQFMAAYPALIAGGRFVVRSRFSASGWIDQIRESEATVTNLVGAMMDFVWKQDSKPGDADTSLRCVFAAPTASSVADEFIGRFGLEAIVEVFGLTETSAPIISPYGVPRPAGAAGLQAVDWFDIKLLDPETDEEVEVGEVGELAVRPKVPWIVSMGYFGMPEKTAEAWRNLWFHTGDALRRDEEGWYYFVDRFKDALRRRGENISSYEIEQAILKCPDVLECAVFGVAADHEAGEDEVMVCVVTRAPDLTAEKLWQHCDASLPAFTVPRYLRFVDSLPKTPSEKVQKSVLRDEGVTEDTADRNLVQSA